MVPEFIPSDLVAVIAKSELVVCRPYVLDIEDALDEVLIVELRVEFGNTVFTVSGMAEPATTVFMFAGNLTKR